MMKNEFGQRLQRAREKAGMTQEQLASTVGVSQQSVAKWESGKSVPRQKVLAALAGVLDLSVDSHRIATDTMKRAGGLPAIRPADSDEDSEEHLKVAQALRDPGDVPDAFPTLDADTVPSEYARLCNERIAAFLGTSDGQWIPADQRISGHWEHAYETAELVVGFMHAPEPGMLRAALNVSIYRKLWRMLTTRAHRKDKRNHLFIVTLPRDPEFPPFAEQTRLRQPGNEVFLHRITTEAALLDVSVFIARSPQQAASIIQSFNVVEPDSWE